MEPSVLKLNVPNIIIISGTSRLKSVTNSSWTVQITRYNVRIIFDFHSMFVQSVTHNISFNFRYLWLGSILFLENSKIVTHTQQTKNIVPLRLENLVTSCYLLAVSFHHISDKPFPKHSTTYRRQEEKWTEKIWMNFWLNSEIRCDSSWPASVLNRLLRRVLQCKWTMFVLWKAENVFLLACTCFDATMSLLWIK